MVRRDRYAQVRDRWHIRRFKIQFDVVLLIQLDVARQDVAFTAEPGSLIDADLRAERSTA